MEGVEKQGFLECKDDACWEEEEESCRWDCLRLALGMLMGGHVVAKEDE